MSFAPKAVRAQTTHVRRGGLAHSFTYGVDMVLIDPETVTGPLLFSRNRLNLTSDHDRDHGGKPGQGRGAAWAREVLAARGLAGFELRLLTQPRFLGYGFNPVSFWLAFDGGVRRGRSTGAFDGGGGDLRAVIAEVAHLSDFRGPDHLLFLELAAECAGGSHRFKPAGAYLSDMSMITIRRQFSGLRQGSDGVACL